MALPSLSAIPPRAVADNAGQRTSESRSLRSRVRGPLSTRSPGRLVFSETVLPSSGLLGYLRNLYVGSNPLLGNLAAVRNRCLWLNTGVVVVADVAATTTTRQRLIQGSRAVRG